MYSKTIDQMYKRYEHLFNQRQFFLRSVSFVLILFFLSIIKVLLWMIEELTVCVALLLIVTSNNDNDNNGGSGIGSGN